MAWYIFNSYILYYDKYGWQMDGIAQNPRERERERDLAYHEQLYGLQDDGLVGSFQGSLHQLAIDQDVHGLQQ